MKKQYPRNRKSWIFRDLICGKNLCTMSGKDIMDNKFTNSFRYGLLPNLIAIVVFLCTAHTMNGQACEAPENVQIDYTTEMPTGEVSWEGDTPSNGWILLTGMEGSINIQEFLSDPGNYENPEVDIEYVTESPHLIYMNMLQPGNYDLFVVADCGNDGMAASDMVNFNREETAEEIISPDCETPYNMTAVETGAGSADISWEPQDGGFYQIAWGPEGLEMGENYFEYFEHPETGSVIVSENPYHLVFTGPDPNQVHYFYMRQFCGDNIFSEWAEPMCVEPSNLESSQDGENIVLTWSPGDYETSWQVAYGPEGFDVNDESNPDVTRVNVNNSTTYTISIYDVELGMGYDFYVRSKCSEENFSEWSGPESFIPELAPCFAVTDMEARHITYSTADIYWEPIGGESSWTVTYGVSPLDPNEAINLPVEGDPEITLTDLDPTTEYDVYVTSICVAGQTAEGETISFITTAGSTGGYCTPIFQNGCEYGVVIDHFILTGENETEIYDLNTGCIDSNYDDRTDESVDFAPGSDYLAWVTSGSISGDHCVIWIDFNNDGTFEETERVAAQSMDSPEEVVLLNIPETASSGARRMRVMVAFAAYPDDLLPCEDVGANGEVHDYTANILELENCNDALAGVPMENFVVCPDETFTIFVLGASGPAEGLERTWQFSPRGANDWMDIEGSDLPSLTLYDGIDQAMDFRYMVTCTYSGDTDVSTILEVGMSTNCYCKPPDSLCFGPSGLQINNVLLPGETVTLDNTSGGGGSCYEDYTLEFAPDLNQGEMYTLTVTANNATLNEDKIKAWIDFNDDKIFGEEDVVLDFTGGLPSRTVTSEFMVPLNVPPGDYRMRVRIGWLYSTVNACNGLGWGETEDYVVTVVGVVGIDEPTASNFTYYPNPVTEVITLTAQTAISSVFVYNLLGQKVLRSDGVVDGNVDVSSLEAGIYIFHVRLEDGETEIFKIIKN